MNPLAAYLPQDRRRALVGHSAIPERASGGVLFADISGFTPLAEALTRALGARRGAEEITRQLNLIYDALMTQIDAFGGSVIGFAGDALTCWFGDAENMAVQDAISAAFAMQDAMGQFSNPPLPDNSFTALGLKISIAYGTTVRFLVGNPSERVMDILAGAPVTRTAHGEQLAKRGEVLIDENCARLLAELVEIGEWRANEAGERFAFITRLRKFSPRTEIETGLEWNDEELRPWVLPSVFEQQRAGAQIFFTELRPVVAVFVQFFGIDLEGDTAAPSKFDRFIRRVQEIVTRYEGTLLEVIVGDKGNYLYVAFGAPLEHDDDPRRALHTAQALLHLPDEFDFLAPLQIGISQGSMRVGAYGATTRRTYGAQGDEVNLAARLMTHASPGELLVSQRIQKNIAEEFDLEPLAPIRLKGKAEPLLAFLVKGTRSGELHYQPAQSGLPMLGRAGELAFLVAKLTRVREGYGEIVGITADAGMGKSRLIAELVRHARRDSIRVLGGECASYATNTPYFVWTSIWREFFEVDPAAPPRRQRRALESAIREYASTRTDALPLLEPLLHLALPENDFARALEPRDRKAALEATLLECLRANAHEEHADGGAFLVVLDDAQWLDPASRDLLELFAQNIADVPVMFVLAYRPQDDTRRVLPRPDALAHFSELVLNELDNVSAEGLLHAKILQLAPENSSAISSALSVRLIAHAQGNPFYLEELINFLNDRGFNLRDRAALDAIDLPNSLHRLVLSRIDQLNHHQKQTLQVASIIGRWFRFQQLLEYYPELGAPDIVLQDLHELERLDLTPIDQSGPDLAYLFKHIVTQQVTYDSLPFATRAVLHEQYARYLETRDATPNVDLLAYHFGHSTNRNQARKYARLAGQAAAARFANPEAIAYFTRALELTGDDAPAERFDLLCAREQVYDVRGEREPQYADLQAIETLAQELNDPQAQALATLRLGWYAEHTGEYANAITHAQNAFAILESLPDDPLRADALILWGQALWHQAQYPEAYSQTARAFAYAQTQNDTHRQAFAMSRLGIIAHRLGEHAEAKRFHQQSLELAQAQHDRRLECLALNNLGLIARELDDFARANDLYVHALRVAREIGDRSTESIILANLTDNYHSRGEYDLAQQYAHETLTVARAARNRQRERIALTTLGQTYWMMGDYERARECTERALIIARETGDRFGEELALGNLAEITLDTGDVTAAFTLAERALTIANDISDREGQAFVLSTLGFASLHTGKSEDARAHFVPASELWGENALTPEALKSRAGLAESYTALGDTEHAQQTVETLLALISKTDPDSVPIAVFLTAHLILDAAHDPRAAPLLNTARESLQRRAAKISDPAMRKSLLDNVRAHALLMRMV